MLQNYPRSTWKGFERKYVAVGSIKSQIGHLKAAAGIAGIIKATMALRNSVIPPSAGFETPNPTVGIIFRSMFQKLGQNLLLILGVQEFQHSDLAVQISISH